MPKNYGTYSYEMVRSNYGEKDIPYFVLSVQPHVAIRLKRVFPRVPQGAAKAISIQATDEAAFELNWFLQRYPLNPIGNAHLYLSDGVQRWNSMTNLVDLAYDVNYVAPDVSLAEPARTYQLLPAAMVMHSGGLLLADDAGLGKTLQGIILAVTPGTLPMLFVTKTDLPIQIRAEFKRFAPDLRTHIVNVGSAYKGVDSPQDLANLVHKGKDFPDVVIMSYSKLNGWANFLKKYIKSVTYDEIQELRRGTTSNRGKAAALISENATYRLGLSATPIFNRGDEIHAVYQFLRPDVLGSESEFAREWTTSGGIVKEPKALGIYLRESGALLKRTKQDVGRELPPVQVHEHYCEHNDGTLSAIAPELTELAKFIVTGGNKRGDSFRAGGELDWKLRQATGMAKADSVASFVDLLIESEEKVLLYAWHHSVYEIYKQRLGKHNPGFYHGGISVPARREAVERFESGKSPLLIMSLRSGAGLDGLQYVPRARSIVFGELDWSPGVMWQCIWRLARDGQADPVDAYMMVCDSGSDPIMAESLGLKASQIAGLMDPNKEEEDFDLTGKLEPSKITLLAERYLKSRGITSAQTLPGLLGDDLDSLALCL